MIVTRQGVGRAGRIWLTFNGAIMTTVVMTGETGQLYPLVNGVAVGRTPGRFSLLRLTFDG